MWYYYYVCLMLLGYGRLACYWWFKPYTQFSTNPRAHVKSPTPNSTEPASHLLLIVPLQTTKPTRRQYRKSVNVILSHIYIYVCNVLPTSAAVWYLKPQLNSYILFLCAHNILRSFTLLVLWDDAECFHEKHSKRYSSCDTDLPVLPKFAGKTNITLYLVKGHLSSCPYVKLKSWPSG
jgi:hypothetical protein